MKECLLCGVEFNNSAYTICFDPLWKSNCWGGDSHNAIGNICVNCGDSLLINNMNKYLAQDWEDTPVRQI